MAWLPRDVQNTKRFQLFYYSLCSYHFINRTGDNLCQKKNERIEKEAKNILSRYNAKVKWSPLNQMFYAFIRLYFQASNRHYQDVRKRDIPAKLRDFKTYTHLRTQDVKVEIRKIANSTRKTKTDEKKPVRFECDIVCVKCEVAFYLSWEVQQPFM